jgi:tight adherence protein B
MNSASHHAAVIVGLFGATVCVFLVLFLVVRAYRIKRQLRKVRIRILAAFPKRASTEESVVDILGLNRSPDSIFTVFRISQIEKRFRSMISLADSRLNGSLLITISFLCSMATMAFLLPTSSSITQTIGMSLLASLLPIAIIAWIAHVKRNRFVNELPDAIDLMCSALQSGHGVNYAIKIVSEELPGPCGAEFRQILQRLNLGQSLAEAFGHSVDRFELFELDLIRLAVQVQREVGGSLGELLQHANNTLKERLKLKKTISTLTAPTQLSAFILGVLPIAACACFFMVKPEYMRPMFSTEAGRALLTMAVCFQILGAIVIKRLATFRI